MQPLCGAAISDQDGQEREDNRLGDQAASPCPEGPPLRIPPGRMRVSVPIGLDFFWSLALDEARTARVIRSTRTERAARSGLLAVQEGL